MIDNNVFNKRLKILPFVSATQIKHIKRNERKTIMIIKSLTHHRVFKSSYQDFSKISIREIKTSLLLIMIYNEHMYGNPTVSYFWLVTCLRMLSIYKLDTVMLCSRSQFISLPKYNTSIIQSASHTHTYTSLHQTYCIIQIIIILYENWQCYHERNIEESIYNVTLFST